MAGYRSEQFVSSALKRTIQFAGLGLVLGVCSSTLLGQEPASAKETVAGKVTAIRFWSLGDVTRVAVEVSSEFTFKHNRLTEPERLFFDIYGANPAIVRRGAHTIAVGDGLLRQIRVAEKEPGVTRIVLDMLESAEATTSQLSNPNRLVIEVRSKESKGQDSHSKERDSKDKDSKDRDSKDKALPSSPPAVTSARPAPEPAPIRQQELAPSAENLVAIDVTPGQTPARERAKRTPPRKFVPPVVARRLTRRETIPVPSISLPLKTLALHITSATFAKDLPVLLPPSGPAPNLAAVTPMPAAVREVPVHESAPLDTPTSVRESRVVRSGGRRPAVARSLETGPVPQPAKRGTITGDRSLTRALGLKLGRVVLDPGHGGQDQGTHGPSGYLEKELSLDVALRLGALLEERLGSEVVYTRSDDTFVPLEERTRIANEHKADLFISIHANSSPVRSASGVETYVLNFTTSKAAMDLATRENASSQRSIYDLNELLQKIALRDKIGESLEFASRLQTSLSTSGARSNEASRNRGIKRAPFVVLIGATMPSVLSEIGFLTNPADEKLLRTPEHRQKIAESLYKGIAAYADTLSRFQVAGGPGRARRTVDSKP